MTAGGDGLASFQGWLDEERLAAGVPGVAAGVVIAGEQRIFVSGSTGAPGVRPVSERTAFQIGSNTKPITATAVMRLVDRGQIDIAAPVTDYLPGFRLRHADPSTVTIHHLLTHQGGFLGDYSGSADLRPGDDAIAAYVAELAEVEQLHPVGAKWSYCNSGMVVLGRVLEVLTGLPYPEAIREFVFDPLGMSRSGFPPRVADGAELAVGHRLNLGSGALVPIGAEPGQPSRAPSGSVAVASAGDLLTFARFHLAGGRRADGTQVLPRTLVERMRQAHADVPAFGATHAYGYGWGIRTLADGTPAVGHGGATATGQVSAFELVPERDVAVVCLTNSATGGALARDATDRLLELAVGSPMAQLVRPVAAPPAVDVGAVVGRYDGVSSVIELVCRDGGLVALLHTDIGDVDESSTQIPLTPVTEGTYLPPSGPHAIHLLDRDASGRPAYLFALGRVFPNVS